MISNLSLVLHHFSLIAKRSGVYLTEIRAKQQNVKSKINEMSGLPQAFRRKPQKLPAMPGENAENGWKNKTSAHFLSGIDFVRNLRFVGTDGLAFPCALIFVLTNRLEGGEEDGYRIFRK